MRSRTSRWSIKAVIVVVALLGPLFGPLPSAYADSKTWVGGDVDNPTDWHDPDNWSPAGVPTASSDVVINDSAITSGPVISAAAVATKVVIRNDNGAPFAPTVAELTVVAGGSLNVSVLTHVDNDAEFQRGTAQLTIQDSASVTLGNLLLLTGARSPAFLNVAGSLVGTSISGIEYVDVFVAGSINISGVISLNGDDGVLPEPESPPTLNHGGSGSITAAQISIFNGATMQQFSGTVDTSRLHVQREGAYLNSGGTIKLYNYEVIDGGRFFGRAGTIRFQFDPFGGNTWNGAGGSHTYGNIQVDPAASVQIDDFATLTVLGNWTNNGTVDLSQTEVTFDGSGQVIGGTGGETFDVLRVSGDAVTLARTIGVTGTLLLSNPVVTGTSRVLATFAVAHVTPTGFVEGNLVRPASDDIEFAVGSGGVYAPVRVEGLGDLATGEVLVKTASGDHAEIGSSGLDTNLTVNRSWTLGRADGTIPATTKATFTFGSEDVDIGANPTAFVVRRRAASTWNTTGTGTRKVTSTQATGLAAFGDFVIGEPDLPLVPSAPDLASASDMGSSQTDNITNDDTPTFTGTGENGSSVTIFVDGVSAASAPVSSGNYSITTGDLPDGPHSISASAVNAEGSSDKSPALAVQIDTVAPSPPAGLSSDPKSPANVNNPVIKGHAEAGSEVVLMDDPCPIEPVASGTATAFRTDGFGVTVADNSTTHFTAISTDKAGNSSECSAPFTYVEDSTIPPRLSIDDVRVVEGTGPDADMIFTLELEWPGSVTSTVKAATKVTGKGAGHADKADFRKASAKIVFAPGEVSKTFVVKLIGDVANEPDETLSVLLKSAKNATIADGKGVGTIQDDDD